MPREECERSKKGVRSVQTRVFLSVPFWTQPIATTLIERKMKLQKYCFGSQRTRDLSYQKTEVFMRKILRILASFKHLSNFRGCKRENDLEARTQAGRRNQANTQIRRAVVTSSVVRNALSPLLHNYCRSTQTGDAVVIGNWIEKPTYCDVPQKPLIMDQHVCLRRLDRCGEGFKNDQILYRYHFRCRGA